MNASYFVILGTKQIMKSMKSLLLFLLLLFPTWVSAQYQEVTVSGPASLLAIDNGDHATDDLFLGVSGKPMRHGQMMGILRAGRQSGKVTVSIRSGKMKGRLTVNLGTRSKR